MFILLLWTQLRRSRLLKFSFFLLIFWLAVCKLIIRPAESSEPDIQSLQRESQIFQNQQEAYQNKYLVESDDNTRTNMATSMDSLHNSGRVRRVSPEGELVDISETIPSFEAEEIKSSQDIGLPPQVERMRRMESNYQQIEAVKNKFTFDTSQ